MLLVCNTESNVTMSFHVLYRFIYYLMIFVYLVAIGIESRSFRKCAVVQIAISFIDNFDGIHNLMCM